MINVQANKDDSFIVELDELSYKILKRSAAEWSISETQHLGDILTNFFDNKEHEFNNRDGPLMARKYDLLDDKQKKTIDNILSTVTIPIPERDR